MPDEWRRDSYGRHQERLFRDGQPTVIIRDGGIASVDRSFQEVSNASQGTGGPWTCPAGHRVATNVTFCSECDQEKSFRQGPVLVVLGVALTVVIAIVVAVGVSEHHHGAAAPPAPTAHFHGYVTDVISSPDGSVLVVHYTVMNTGNASAPSSCYITAGDPSSDYFGYDTFFGNNPLAPGASENDIAHVVITHNGAGLVTLAETNIDCL